MKRGYVKPLYFLPFDHRQSYVTGMFKFSLPLSAQQHDKVADSKQIIYEGFQQAIAQGVSTSHAGLLVDEEFGALILRDAFQKHYITALCAEKSGSDEFEFQYGDQYGDHIEQFDPTFVKVLVRYNPQGDAALNLRQTARLKRLSDYCQDSGRLFMFELLVPATEVQLKQAQGERQAYDLTVRPELMVQAIGRLQDAGVEPDVWKIEGLDHRADCERVVEVARRGGRTDVGCIVLGRGADEQKVAQWLAVAATVPGFIGFAVGRTSFWDAVASYESGKATREQASAQVAARYSEWVRIFEHHSAARGSHAFSKAKVKP